MSSKTANSNQTRLHLLQNPKLLTLVFKHLSILDLSTAARISLVWQKTALSEQLCSEILLKQRPDPKQPTFLEKPARHFGQSASDVVALEYFKEQSVIHKKEEAARKLCRQKMRELVLAFGLIVVSCSSSIFCFTS